MRNQGVALVLVLIIIFTLLVIAMPFVLSMILQERQSDVVVHRGEAIEHASSATNYALGKLMRTHDYYERKLAPYGPDSYIYDDVRKELLVTAEEPVKSQLGVGFPNASLWGMTVEDEQGKINLTSAPPQVIATVQRLASTFALDTRSFTTLYSIRESPWVHPQRVRKLSPDGAGFWADDPNHYARGTRLRFRGPNLSRDRICEIEDIDPSGMPWFRTNPPPPSDLNVIVEVEARHPVDVNTAGREALICVFNGLRVIVPPDQADVPHELNFGDAEALATLIYKQTREVGPIKGLWDLVTLVSRIQSLSPYQKAAVLSNAVSPTLAALDGSGTVPFCYKAHEVFTVLSSASINNPAGAQVGLKRFRDIIEVAPPIALEHRLESQLDFEMMMHRPKTYLDGLEGFPFGNRIATYPAKPKELPDIALQPNQAYFTSKTSKDMRGAAAILMQRFHFDDEIEGDTSGTLRYPWNQVFAANPNPVLPDVTAGGCEFWIRFDSVPADGTAFFSIREDDKRNRLTLEYTQGELRLTAADEGIGQTGITGGVARVRRPFTPQRDIWYHIGIYWKGTKYGHLTLLVDGFSNDVTVFDHVNHGGRKVYTTLAQPLDAPDPQNPISPVSLADNSWLPDPVFPGETVALEIGSEVILYSKSQKKAIRSARAQQNVQGYAHPQDARVSIFGYTALLDRDDVQPPLVGAPAVPQGYRVPMDRLTRGSTRTLSKFSTNLTRMLAKTIAVTDTEIPVVSPAFFANPQAAGSAKEAGDLQKDFPARGYVIVGQELIKYDGIGTAQVTIPEPLGPKFSVPTLKVVQRGAIGTTAAPHMQGESVPVSSLYVASTDGFTDPCFVQIEDEWFGPVMKDPTDRNFFVGIVQAGIPYGLNRAVGGTPLQDHSDNETVLPVFLTRDLGARLPCGRYDTVTITDANLNRLLRRIRHAAAYAGKQLVAFWDQVPTDYVQDGQFVRLLKFPSDELMSRSWLQLQNPSVALCRGATIDELKFFAAPKSRDWRLASAMNSSSNANVALNGTGSMRAFGGAILCGTEIVAYAELNAAAHQIARITRGFLSSHKEVHDAGDLLFHLSFLPLSSVKTAMDAATPTIDMNQPVDVFDRHGYLLIDREVLFFEDPWVAVNQPMLTMPTRLRSPDGLWRGMFGTAPAAHADWAMVYAIPYRYYDTYKRLEFDNRMSYFQASASIPDAHWHEVHWIEENPLQVTTHVLVRMDGKGEWWDTPDPKGTLREFTDPAAKNALDYHALKSGEGRIDIQFKFEYGPGTFWPADSWKQSPKIRGVTVDYERTWKVLYHDEK